jgi:hypothetical protein
MKFWFTKKDMWKLSLDPPTTSHVIILMLFLFVLSVLGCYYKKLK